MVSHLLLLSKLTETPDPGDYFTIDQARQVVQDWRTPGRYETQDADPQNPYQIVQTAEGATWLYNYYKKRSPGVRILPTQNPTPQNATHQAWETWISRIYEADVNRLRPVAESLNLIEQGHFGPPLPEPPRTFSTPTDLQALAGAPPRFATIVRRQNHHLKLDGYTVTLTDAPELRPGYPYLRATTGVQHPGSPVSATEISTLARKAGLDDTLVRIFQSVSALEGGFDAVNTYDTGYVSVGFIQFASLQGGSGTLGRLLARYKQRQPQAFKTDFRRFGVEVTQYGHLIVLDPTTGKEHFGPEAAKKIVEDKRLTAVFQRAGAVSEPFRLEQLRLAAELFDPRSRTLLARLDGRSVPVPVNQIFKSEAGLATLMDRLINTGSLGEAGAVAATVADEYQAKTVADLARLEDVLVRRLTYRSDFLASKWLTKPSPAPGLVASTAPGTMPGRPAPPSLRGSLQAGNEPLPVVPGFNVNLNAVPGQQPKNSGNPPKGPIAQSTEPTERAEPPVKPDSQVGRPITNVGG